MLVRAPAVFVPWPRRVATVAFVAAGLVLGLAADASAGTVRLVTTGSGDNQVSTLTFDDAAGERNDVLVQATQTAVQVTDRAVAPVAGPGCRPSADPAMAVCPIAPDHPPLILDIQGGGGDDVLTVPQPEEPEILDVLVGFISGGDGHDTITVTARDTSGLLLFMFVNGDGGDDRLVGGEGEDRLAGGAGKDTLVGAGNDDDLDGDGAGRTAEQFALALQDKPIKVAPPAAPADDVLDGGPGDDTADYAGRTQPLRVDLADPAPDGSAGEADRLTGIEDVDGGNGPNVLLGDAGSNSLDGSARAPDVLDGRGGDDYLFGYGDDDTLLGGPGDDFLQRPGRGSSCGSGRDTLRGQRFAPAALQPLRFGACELALSRGGIVSVKLTPVRLRAGVFTIHVTTSLPAGDNDDPVRFTIMTGSGRVAASRSVRIAGRRDRVQGLTLRLRGRAPSGSTVRLVMVEHGITGRSLYVELPLRG